jgi:hypothetical protein
MRELVCSFCHDDDWPEAQQIPYPCDAILLRVALEELRKRVGQAVELLEEIDSTDRRDDEFLESALAILTENTGGIGGE